MFSKTRNFSHRGDPARPAQDPRPYRDRQQDVRPRFGTIALFLVGIVRRGPGLGGSRLEEEVDDLQPLAIAVDPLLDASALGGRADDQVGLAPEPGPDLRPGEAPERIFRLGRRPATGLGGPAGAAVGSSAARGRTSRYPPCESPSGGRRRPTVFDSGSIAIGLAEEVGGGRPVAEELVVTRRPGGSAPRRRWRSGGSSGGRPARTGGAGGPGRPAPGRGRSGPVPRPRIAASTATRASASPSPRWRSRSASSGRSGRRVRAFSARADASPGLASTCFSSDRWTDVGQEPAVERGPDRLGGVAIGGGGVLGVGGEPRSSRRRPTPSGRPRPAAWPRPGGPGRRARRGRRPGEPVAEPSMGQGVPDGLGDRPRGRPGRPGRGCRRRAGPPRARGLPPPGRRPRASSFGSFSSWPRRSAQRAQARRPRKSSGRSGRAPSPAGRGRPGGARSPRLDRPAARPRP